MAAVHDPTRPLAFALFLAGCGGNATTQTVTPEGGAGSETGTQLDASAGGTDAAPDTGGGPDASRSPDGAADASGASDGTAEMPPPPQWTPDAIRSSLAFWFTPASLVTSGTAVTRWVDLSGNGNDATQGVATYQPTYNPSGIAGLPSATLNGPVTFLSIADNPTMQWGMGDFVVLAVVRAAPQTTSPEAMIYQKTGAYPYDGASLYLNADKPSATSLAAAQVSGQVYVVSSPPPATFVDSTVHLLGARRTATTLEIRVDGVVSNSLTSAPVGAADVSSAGLAGIIGQNGYDPTSEHQQVHGDLAELVAVRGPLAQTDLAKLEQYLKQRYRIP